MNCEKCWFPLPEAWPVTKVEVPSATPDGAPTVTVEHLLCVPCSRAGTARLGAMTEYRPLPPHESAG
jgi:hypothetical protein